MLRDLGAAAPELGRLIKRPRPVLDERPTRASPSLGDALETGRPALIRSRPLIRKLGAFATRGQAAVADLDKLTASLDRTRRASSGMHDFLFYLTLADQRLRLIGHYLRAGLVATATCSDTARRSAATTANLLGRSSTTAPGRRARPRPPPTAPPRARRPKPRRPPKTNSLLESLIGELREAQPTRVSASRASSGCSQRAKQPSKALQTPTSRCSTTCWGRTSEPAPPRAALTASPVLVGAVTRAGHDRRRVPLLQREHRPAVRAHLRPRRPTCPTPPSWSWATRCASAARASAQIDEIDADAAPGRHARTPRSR